MTASKSLGRTITRAYLVFAFGATIFFAVIAAIAVEGIEQHLVDDRLQEVANWALPRHAAGLPVAMPAGLSFHQGDDIPVALRGLQPGATEEVTVDGVGLHVLTGNDPRGTYVVVDHESDYLKVELVVYSMFVLSFIGIILFSLFIGRYIGRRVVTPIVALANAVPDRNTQLPLLDRDDELGVLARAFDAYTAEQRRFLDRERFFTGDVSHELRTPLTIISGAAEILIEQQSHVPTVAAPARRIQRASAEAIDYVNVLLMLARAPERLPRPPIDLSQLARDQVARYQSLVAGKPLVLHYQGSSGVTVHAAPELCAALIGNLVRNACQYTISGEVLVTLDDHTLAVTDTGPGLPPSILAVVNGGTAAAADGASAGTGLGLGLVRRICEHLGADLAVGARDGGGTRFIIRFPVELTGA